MQVTVIPPDIPGSNREGYIIGRDQPSASFATEDGTWVDFLRSRTQAVQFETAGAAIQFAEARGWTVINKKDDNSLIDVPTDKWMNMPMTPAPEPAGITGWFSTWKDAVTKPNEQTYAMLAEHPDAMSNKRAFTWIFLAGTVSALITGVLQAVLQLAGLTPQVPGFSELVGGVPQGSAASLGIAICASPIAGAFVVLFFAIFVGIIQWVAKMFGGTGNFSQLAYTMAAISVPFFLVSSVISPFSPINGVGFCVGGISLLLWLYTVILQVMAVKAVNKFGFWQALGSYLVPLLLSLCLIACLAIGVFLLVGGSFGDIFNEIIPTP